MKKIEKPELNPHTNTQLICDKEIKSIREENVSSINDALWESQIHHIQKYLKLNHYLSPCTNINSKVKTVVSLSQHTYTQKISAIRAKTIKFIDMKISKPLADYWVCWRCLQESDFKTKRTKAKINRARNIVKGL